MPPRSPLPQRHGLNPAWLRTNDHDHTNPLPWPTIAQWIDSRIGEFVDVFNFVEQDRFVYQSGAPVAATDVYTPNTFVWFHRDLQPEAMVPGELHTVYRDERIVVIDKPPFLSTIPRGRHVLQSVVVRLRDELGLPELSPVHRLDRVTSGLLILTTERRWRAPYQMLFQERNVEKVYHSLALIAENVEFPVTVRNHLHKQTGELRVRVVPDATPNTESFIEFVGLRGEHALYRLTPHSGKTHQLRQHMLSLGAPILGDPLYPEIRDIVVDDFREPLQLLASGLTFIDPIDSTERQYRSVRTLPISR